MVNGADSAAEALRGRAAAGAFRMDTDAARGCAANFLRFADAVEPQLSRAARTHRLTGFGGFDSARQLRCGFEHKGVELSRSLSDLRDAAVRMAEVYLLAGGLIEEADHLPVDALRALAQGIDG